MAGPDYLDDDVDQMYWPKFRTPPFLPPGMGSGIGPVPPNPSQGMPQVAPPAPSPVPLDTKPYEDAQAKLAQVRANRPALPQPKWYQRLGAGALGAAVGYTNAAGRVRQPIDPSAAMQGILAPGYARKQAGYQQELEAAQQNAAAEQTKLGTVAAVGKTLAETEETKQRGQYYGQQAETLAAEGKRAPRGNYIPVPGGGLFDANAGEWVKEPPAKATATPDTLEIDPEKGKALGIKPTSDGRYIIPKEGIGPFLTSTMKPEKAEHLDSVGLAIKAAGGDPANPASVSPEVATKAAAILKPQMPGVNLTPEAVQFWAQAAAQGIPLPSLGMGASGAKARQDIINEAPKQAGGTPLAANRATQRADTNSLGNIVKMRDSVISFENTASKNLDLFQQQAKKVIDSGSPWINQPLRSINRNALGNADVAAFDAARQVALTEIAKVVNNPSMSSVLSDTARKEVLSLIPANATLKQIYNVANVLKQDMANRHGSLDQQIGDIEKRMGGGQQGSAPATFDVADPRGVVHHFPNQQAADQFKQAAHIQ